MKKLLTMTVATLVMSATTSHAQIFENSRYYNQRTGQLDYSQRYGNYSKQHNGLFWRMSDNYYGLRLGPSYSTIKSDDRALNAGNSITGVNVGAVMGISLSSSEPLYLELGLMYNEKGGKTVSEGKKITYNLNYLEIPAVVKYGVSLGNRFMLQPFGGCYMAFGVGGKRRNYAERETISSFSSHYFKRFDAGLRFGCGVSYDMFYVDMSYDIGLANICHDYFDRSQTRCFGISFGVNY
mgnify:CR=1 FL=1